MKIEELKKLGVIGEKAEKILAMTEKELSDKTAELDMASEKIGELSEENKKLSDKIAELSEEIAALEQENEKLLKDKQLMEESRTVDMGLKHGAAAFGNQFGFKFTGVRPGANS